MKRLLIISATTLGLALTASPALAGATTTTTTKCTFLSCTSIGFGQIVVGPILSPLSVNVPILSGNVIG